jgi:polyphosphate kinase 2 (PPK2 family)
MLEKVDLTRKLSKKQYQELLPRLQRRLYDLEKSCWDAHVPTIIVFEGWDAAGKGTTINLLTSRLDPRGFKLHAVQAPRTYETHLPWLWRFWQKIPNFGEMAIFDRSWYGRVLVERVEGLSSAQEWQKGYRDIASFERTLSDDGYVILKFFLHISKNEQERRFKRLARDPLTAWHVQAEDWDHHEKYDQYVVAIEEMLEHTDTEWGPWTIVEATDRRWSRVRVFQAIIQRLERAITDRGIALPPEGHPEGQGPEDEADSDSLEEELEAKAEAWTEEQEESNAGDA